MKPGIILALVFLVSTSAAPNWTVYLRRVGPIRIGMTLPEVRRIIGDAKAEVLLDGIPTQSTADCSYLASPAKPEGLGLMFKHGRLARIDVYGPGIRTASGIQVGDTEDMIKRVYRDRISVEAHHYVERGHYLFFEPKTKNDAGFGIVFETDGDTVEQFRIGTLEAIALVEGCS